MVNIRDKFNWNPSTKERYRVTRNMIHRDPKFAIIRALATPSTKSGGTCRRGRWWDHSASSCWHWSTSDSSFRPCCSGRCDLDPHCVLGSTWTCTPHNPFYLVYRCECKSPSSRPTVWEDRGWEGDRRPGGMAVYCRLHDLITGGLTRDLHHHHHKLY